jgi:hypothetical protein
VRRDARTPANAVTMTFEYFAPRCGRTQRPVVEFGGDPVEVFGAVCGEITALGEVLLQQAVGVLICGALPGCVRVAEVDVDISVDGDLFPLAHLWSLVPGQ